MKLCFNQIESRNNLLKSSFNFFFLRFNLLKQGFIFFTLFSGNNIVHKKILETRIGMEKGVPIWEVAYKEENGRLGYHIITLKDGEYVRDIGNI